MSLRAEILKPAPTLSLPEWADTYRYLSKASSSEPGRWRTSRVEVARGPMLAVTDPSVEKITLMVCTQLLKTETMNNIVGYFMHQDPSPMILLQPNVEMAESWSKERLTPMLTDTPVLSSFVTDKKRESGNRILQKSFPGGFISMVGANAPSGLAMRPIRVVLCDETDKYPPSAGKEGDPIKLVTERTATFWNRLIVLACSPTIKGSSRIEQSYLESDQRIYEVPCPKCKHIQEMQWEQVRWEDGKPETAKYHCPECEYGWSERERLKQIQLGEWRATAEFKGHAGFNCSKLVSPWEPLSRLVEKFEDAKDKPEQMKTFINTNLARTYQEDGAVPDWRRLYERREDYPKNVIPAEAIFVTMGCDVQRDRLELEIVAWGANKVSWSMDYRVIQGAPEDAKTWDEFEKVVYEQFRVEGKDERVTRGIDKVCVDSGFATQDVYHFTQRFPRSKVLCIKGFDNYEQIISSPKAVDIKRDGTVKKHGNQFWKVGSSYLKFELYGWLSKNKPVNDEADPYGYCHFPMYGDDFFKMLTAEEIRTKIDDKGFPKKNWVKTGPNEALDVRCYARAAASVCGLDRLKPKELEYLKTKSKVSVEKDGTSAPVRATTTKNKRKKSSYFN